MGIALTREQVIALAPDDSSAKAAAGLVSDSKWILLGADADAVWGECQGSGSKPYQAQVDLAALVSRCSCPSRKFPCKHGLALLLLYSQGNPRFANAARPTWVEEWLASRRERSEKKEKAAGPASATTVGDAAGTAASARREGARWKRIEAGATELERWIADQFRRGLARFGPEQRQDWLSMAARMVDAQAPALAPRIQEALGLMDSGAFRHADVIERLGLLQLLVEGVARRSALSPQRLADVRVALGWPPDKEDVAAAGDVLTDVWRVLGQVTVESEAKLVERRVWLVGIHSRRHALLQDFAYGGRAWEHGWRDFGHYDATLRFYPGSVPLRALASEVRPAANGPATAFGTVDSAIEYASQALASNPWLAQVPLVLPAAVFRRQDAGWGAQTAAGIFAVVLADAAAWGLMAFGGGHPVSLMGEWDGRELRVLSAWDESGGQWALESGA